ncbi:MAG TPA: methyltransferase domain-containing protein [Gemmatimonadaceae bacterium]
MTVAITDMITGDDSATASAHDPTTRFKCLGCGATLALASTHASCASCGSNWPVRDGVIRFFEPGYYWGEISRSEATSFLSQAEREGWRLALERHFANDPSFLTTVLDTQRTSWVPLLGLDHDAVALDIGSGYGAITHALSQQAKEVYSVEAIPERVDFTRVRLAQEGISNVQLVQGSALELPLMDGSFDLIVVNGVLEWLGEWDTERNPREIQLTFLRQLNRMLKPGGVVVIGIENRIGLAALLGEIDHSGVPYTSLMPRWLASLYLRHDRRQHHRTVLNSKRQYRTYTYSEFGYRRLLADSGFSAAFYWANPGYNLPYEVVPIHESFPRRHLEASLDRAPSGSRLNWRRKAKRLLARLRLVRPTVSEFLIMAEKQSSAELPAGHRIYRALQAKLPAVPRVLQPVASLVTYSFARKALVRIFESSGERPTLFVKTSTPMPGSRETVAAEFRHLSLLRARLADHAAPGFAVPTPIGTCELGRLECTVESAAPGRELTDILREHFRNGRTDLVRRQMERCIDISVELAKLLFGAPELAILDPAWWTLPVELLPATVNHIALHRLLDSVAADRDNHDRVQHGDFTIENVVIDEATDAPTVVDWEHALRGLPPMYDCFSALISLLAVIPSRHAGNAALMEGNFLDAFFGGGRWAPLFRELLTLACTRHSVALARVWPLFVQFLVVRTQFYLHRRSSGAELSTRMLELTWQHRDRFLFPASAL